MIMLGEKRLLLPASPLYLIKTETEDNKMPVITFEAAALTKEQKQTLVKEFTETAARVTGLPEAGFYVFIKENAMDNVGVGGQLLSDRK